LQRAGFAASRVYECHGNIHRLQCTKGKACKHPVTGVQGKPWGEKVTLKFDEKTCRAEEPLPTCHVCGALARPNLWFCTDSVNTCKQPLSLLGCVSNTLALYCIAGVPGARALDGRQ
jgi:NAD-dependent SIR2 family protein deacetylase